MRQQALLGAVCLLTILEASTAFSPDIRADTDRDGKVDLTGNTGVAGNAFWSNIRGAIFLPNIGDSHHKCSSQNLIGNPLSNAEIAGCHDASGHLAIAPQFLATVKTVPTPGLPDQAYAHVYANLEAAYSRMRLFRRNKNQSTETSWYIVDKEFSFNASQLREGLDLGLDGREVATNSNIWNGDVVLKFYVFDEGSRASDTLALRLAPVLTHNHLQKVNTLISVAANNATPTQEQSIQGSEDALQVAGVERPLLLLSQSDDIWAQDFIEPAFASMPGPDGPVSTRIILRFAQSIRTAGRQVFKQLRGNGIGRLQPAAGFGHREINSFGNLETISPYTSKSGVEYKAGRIIMGKHFGELPLSRSWIFWRRRDCRSR